MTSASRLLLGALSLVAAILPAQAQTYPCRSIELVVPFAAGNAPDIVARGLAEGLGKQLGQQVIVVNKPGAGGAIGYKYLDSKKPDGYTMALSSNSVSTGLSSPSRTTPRCACARSPAFRAPPSRSSRSSSSAPSAKRCSGATAQRASAEPRTNSTPSFSYFGISSLRQSKVERK